MIVPSKVLGGAPASTEDKNKQRETIYGQRGVLSVLDTQLGKSGAFICGDGMTVVDVLLYCEISTILALTSKSEGDLRNNNPNIHKWFLRMRQVDSLNDLDKELTNIINRFDLAEK
jgi:glutathione S-transferase